MKKYLLNFCLLSVLFLNHQLSGMEAQIASIRRINLLDGNLVFSLVNGNQVLTKMLENIIAGEQRVTVMDEQNKQIDNDISCLGGYTETTDLTYFFSTPTGEIKLLYQLNTPNYIFPHRGDHFFIGIKIKKHPDIKLEINDEQCYLSYHCDINKPTWRTFYKFRNFMNVTYPNYDSFAANIQEYLAQYISIFIALFQLQDTKQFESEYTQQILTEFNNHGKLIELIIPKCLHCLDRSKLSHQERNKPLACPICNKESSVNIQSISSIVIEKNLAAAVREKHFTLPLGLQ